MALPAVGETVAATRAVTQAQIDAYAAASGDHNPLHTDPAFAAQTPLGGTVAHGMLVLAWLSALLTETYGRAWLEHGSLRIRFRAPARPGDTLRVSASVRGLQPAAGGAQVALDIRIANERDEVVLDGQAGVLTPAP